MDQKTALHRFHHGAFLIIAGVPPKTEFGIDCSKFVIAEKFRGVKMIPPGPHFVYCASVGPFGDTAPRVGFMHCFREREIVIREWDAETEELRIRTKGDPEVEKQFIQENIREFDELLAPYDYDSLPKWHNLTTYVTAETVLNLSPSCGIIRTCADLLSCSNDDRPRGGGTCSQSTSPKSHKIDLLFDEDNLLPQLKPIPGTAPNFTKIPPRFCKEASPAEITSSFMDSIVALDKLMGSFSTQESLLAEIQFSFALFVAGCSTDGLAHWRKILAIICNTEEGIQKYKDFYRKFLLCVQYQLPHLPVEVMQPSSENTVYQDVRKLVANCILGKVRDVDHFKSYLSETMLWTFEDIFEEDPEDLPVIVECT
ncbi:protein AAR2 homolog [Phlebotomus papatasi]|uniref:protein AAR2 homolog n=1 Tax=Phlebotomus papatasi TaxID=29031 RepID=UPI0024846CD5|nr:protein AAR2 homolog [Phlebotomus papatasi]